MAWWRSTPKTRDDAGKRSLDRAAPSRTFRKRKKAKWKMEWGKCRGGGQKLRPKPPLLGTFPGTLSLTLPPESREGGSKTKEAGPGSGRPQAVPATQEGARAARSRGRAVPCRGGGRLPAPGPTVSRWQIHCEMIGHRGGDGGGGDVGRHQPLTVPFLNSRVRAMHSRERSPIFVDPKKV